MLSFTRRPGVLALAKLFIKNFDLGCCFELGFNQITSRMDNGWTNKQQTGATILQSSKGKKGHAGSSGSFCFKRGYNEAIRVP